jgi:hypothetical protein
MYMIVEGGGSPANVEVWEERHRVVGGWGWGV